MAGRPEFCAVCGDPAIGFHYDVASCSGCRSFFRRTIKQEKEYACKREGRCMAEKDVERANCKACRLDACIEAGMNPQALQSADIDIPSNKLAQMIVQRQTAKRAAAVALVRSSTSPTMEDRVQGLIDELILTKQAHDRIRSSIFTPTPDDGYNLDKLFGETGKMGHPWASMMDGDNLQIVKLYSLTVLSQARAPPTWIMEGRLKWWPLADCIYTIEYLRTFPFFDELSRIDQRILAIHTVSSATNLTRSYYSVEQRSEVMINPDGMRHNGQWKTVFDLEYDCEIIIGINRLAITESEYALLKAIVCANHEIIGLSQDGREVLEQYQAMYRKSLLSLALATRGPLEGPRFFSAALLLLSTLTKLTLSKKVEHKQVYPIYRNTKYACPIIEEILYEDPLLN
ncbi:hypothetical protein PRIPAC_75838 [Pristionchus pacificus]|uniref:Nuclear receptor n=1 Tax=Pristionchus pacificus TaxID=54126 RepID=A0A2A6BG79_PRIPA|nr:hypothetical protein PRIPAC_75838 [Pristionchus pacificus]|eukprot:PDM64925.1 nuclear receptor [Pristionchus pacificus]